MKHFTISELQLREIFDLLECGYHEAYTDDNGNMKENEIDDRFFDLEYAKDGE